MLQQQKQVFEALKRQRQSFDGLVCRIKALEGAALSPQAESQAESAALSPQAESAASEELRPVV